MDVEHTTSLGLARDRNILTKHAIVAPCSFVMSCIIATRRWYFFRGDRGTTYSGGELCIRLFVVADLDEPKGIERSR